MYKECRSPKSSARQAELEKYLLNKLLLCRYEDLSINDLCEELAINRKTFYRYFTGKQGALYALIDHTLEQLDNWILEHYSEEHDDPKAYLEIFFQFWAENKLFLQAMNYSDLWTTLFDRAFLYVSESRWPSTRDIPEEWNTNFSFLSEILLAGATRILNRWYLADFSQTPEQLAQIAASDLTKALSYWKPQGK